MSAMQHAGGIKTLGPDGLERLFSELGEPAYRARQVTAWLYARGANSWGEMTDIPTSLRARLAEEWPLHTPMLADKQVSSDGTRKYLWRLHDDVTVESVGIPTPERLTVCFSTQAGCAFGCSFCATGTGGFVRDLLPGEIVDQVRLVSDDFGKRVTNAVAMGQGEPFAAYESTLGGLRLLNSADGLGIGARHITVSTCGLIDGIECFALEPEQFTLAVSLHSAIQKTRDQLMPGVRGMPLGVLRTAISHYAEKTGRRTTLEYALIAGVNDSVEHLEALADFARGMLVHINLIPVNPVGREGLTRPAAEIGDRFARRLEQAGIEATVRTERGADIDAACGQLSQRQAAR